MICLIVNGAAMSSHALGRLDTAVSVEDNKREGLTLTWRDLSVWVKKKRPGLLWNREDESTQILDNVNGIAKSGSLLAIMGASGAGKTTLLATISQRIKGEVTGHILVNGRPVDSNFMTHVSGFVPQQDLAVESLTVKEHMEFMARLMMDSRTRTSSRQHRISCLLSELGLTKCKHTKLSALSGGERKRLSLAVQLLTNPPLLFCDEPTTGLDSYSAQSVVEKLREFALQGKAVVCTIHQPASGIFDLFTHVLLLASGRVAFYGEISAAARHFTSLNMICPQTFSKAEFYISQLAVRPGKEEECTRKIQWICDEFESSPYSHELEEQLSYNDKHKYFFKAAPDLSQNKWSASLSDSSSSEKEDDFQKFLSIRKPRRITQLYWLMWRNVVDIYRNGPQNLLRVGFYMLIALLLATPYTNLQVDQEGIQNVQGLMYLIITETIFTFSYSVFHTFPGEIPILLREIANGLYKPGPYYLSKMIVLLPRSIVESLMYTTLIFWIAGLEGGFRDFIFFCIPVAMSAISATAYGCVMSAAFESVATATLVSVPIEFVTLTFSGLFLQLGDLPARISWIRYVSQFYYGTEAISILQWEQIDHIKCPDDPMKPCISSGREVLENYGYQANNYSLDMFGLLSIYCVSHIAGFIAIVYRSKKQPIY
ncbi:protein scarlet-like [Anabrus simplex]|uniref:protein scarlet-like n=1 Tax=Anabrus simplex TaxID=316456 RepID=UPI0035A296EC